MRILVAEDNLRLLELVAETLREEGYGVDGVATVEDLLNRARLIRYDLFIIDLMLPDGDGLDAIRSLRAQGISAQMLIMTAKGSIDDRVSGLDAGADDYLIKPINRKELLARVRAVMRRPAELFGPIMQAGNLELDESKAEVRCSGQWVDLRLSEWRLLAILIRQKGSLVRKETIAESLSDFERGQSANSVEVLMSRIRRVLDPLDTGIVIETVRGIGYRLREIFPAP